MATRTYRVGSGVDGNFGALFEADQTAASRTDGWTVAKIGSTNMAEFDVGVKQASGTFSSAAKPASLLTGSTANAFKTPAADSGSYAATAWTFTFAVRAGTASSQAGRMRMRVFRSKNADGSAATEITGATQIGTTSATLSTSADVTTVVTWTPSAAFDISSEYLFFALAWEITTASGSNSGDVLIRTGQSAGGSRLVTSDFVLPTPVSGTDANGTTTESASIVQKYSSADFGTSGGSEITTVKAILSDVDLTGAETEVGNPVVPVSSSDTNGTTTEAGSAVLTKADILTQDPGALATLGDIPVKFSTYAQLPQTYATYAALESGPPPMPALNEVVTVTQSFITTDANGTTTESGSVTRVQVSNADTGTITDAATPKAVVSDGDPTGPETEVASVNFAPSSADVNGSTTESGSVVAQVSATDVNGTVTEAQTPVAKVGDIDSGTTSEVTGNIGIRGVTDANSTTTESGSTLQVTPVSSSDTNSTTTESTSLITQQQIAGSDANGTVTESAAIAQTTADVATDSEVATLLAKPSATDSGTISEVAALAQVATDAGTLAEATALTSQITTTDSNSTTTELASLRQTTADSGTTTESATAGAQISTSDSGTISETAALRQPTADAATVSEAASVVAQITATDSGTISESGSTPAQIATTDANGATTEFGTTAQINSVSSSDSGGVSTGAPAFSPTSIPGLGIWFDASQLALSDGQQLTSWPDLSGAGHHGVLVSTAPPEYGPVLHANTLNGKPVVRFYVNDNAVRVNGSGISTDYTLVYIGRLVNGGTAGRVVSGIYPPNNILFGYWNGFQDVGYDNGFTSPDTRTPVVWDQWKMYSADGSAASGIDRFFSDGALLGTTTAVVGWGGTFGLSGYDAATSAETCDAEVAEVCFYNRRLSGAERQQVEAYMRAKWIAPLAGDEAQTLVVAIPGVDLGILVEAASMGATITATESGTTTEATGLIATAVSSDSGTTTESATVKAQVSSADSGAIAETTLIRLPSSDTATASETTGLTAQLSSVDVGTITETVITQPFTADIVTISDVASVTRAFVSTADTATTIENAGVSSLSAKLDNDLGTVSETALVGSSYSSSDSGTISESVPKITIVASGVDLATAAEVVALVAKVASGDNATSSEAAGANVVIVAADSGTASETVARIGLGASDLATGIDSEFVHAYYTDGDEGTAEETEKRWPPALLFTDQPAGVILAPTMGYIDAPTAGQTRVIVAPAGSSPQPSSGRIL